MTEQETPAPETATVDLNKFLSLVEKLIERNSTTPDEMARVSAEAAVTAARIVSGEHMREERGGPKVSPFNPLGERDHPRPDLARDYIFGGIRLQKEQLTREEIELLNRVQPGLYHRGEWEVINKEPGSPTPRVYEIKFPYATPDQRANLPPSLVAMLQEMVEGGPVPA